MSDLNKKAWSGLVFIIVVVAVLLFLPAGTIYYWQAWVYLLLLTICITAITLYLMQYDPELLKRRMAVGTVAEKEKSQKRIQFIGQFAFIAIFVLPALDYRLGWSSVPFLVVLIADLLVCVGFFIVFLVFKANSFTSAIIEVDKTQKVISTGPYAIVRHPMYSGSLLVLFATSIALGSWWGLVAFLPMLYVIVWRLREEEGYLAKNLEGYTTYCKKVHWRLVPYIF